MRQLSRKLGSASGKFPRPHGPIRQGRTDSHGNLSKVPRIRDNGYGLENRILTLTIVLRRATLVCRRGLGSRLNQQRLWTVGCVLIRRFGSSPNTYVLLLPRRTTLFSLLWMSVPQSGISDIRHGFTKPFCSRKGKTIGYSIHNTITFSIAIMNLSEPA